jgi:hypothetical protein
MCGVYIASGSKISSEWYKKHSWEGIFDAWRQCLFVAPAGAGTVVRLLVDLYHFLY